MVRKPKLDLHLPSVMKKMYGGKYSRENILRNGIAQNDVNDNHESIVDFRENQIKFDMLGCDEPGTSQIEAKLNKKKSKSEKHFVEMINDEQNSKPKKKHMLNFKRKCNKQLSNDLQHATSRKGQLEYNIDDDMASSLRTSKSLDDPDYYEIRMDKDSLNDEHKHDEVVIRSFRSIPEYDIDEDPIYRSNSQNITRVEIKTNEDNNTDITHHKSSADQNHITIKTIPEYDINEETKIVLNLNKEKTVYKNPQPDYNEVLHYQPNDNRNSFTGSLVYEHDVAENYHTSLNYQWYNEKYVRNDTDNDVEYLELTSETDTSDFVGKPTKTYSREWYEDEESIHSSDSSRKPSDNNVQIVNTILKNDIVHCSRYDRKEKDEQSNSVNVSNLKLKIYPIEYVDEDQGYHGSNEQSYNDQYETKTNELNNDSFNGKQNGMLRKDRQRQLPNIIKTVTFKTPSVRSSYTSESFSSRNSSGSEHLLDAWEMVQLCERNLRMKDEIRCNEESDCSNEIQTSHLEPPIPSPRLSIQSKVDKVIGNSETTTKYKAVVRELKKSCSFSETDA